MEFKDYLKLVQIYNPPRGWYATRRAEAYAYKLEMEGLSHEQTILRLLKDKTMGYKADETAGPTPSHDIDWVSYFALIIAVIALIKAFF